MGKMAMVGELATPGRYPLGVVRHTGAPSPATVLIAVTVLAVTIMRGTFAGSCSRHFARTPPVILRGRPMK